MFSSRKYILYFFLLLLVISYTIFITDYRVLVIISAIHHYFTLNYQVLSGLYTITLPKNNKSKLSPPPPLPTSGSLPSLCVVNFRAGLSKPVLWLNLFNYLSIFVFVQKPIVILFMVPKGPTVYYYYYCF